jgi:uncharacterized protein YukJ
MGIKGYCVLKGRPVDRRRGSGSSPHYQALVVDDAERYRIAVNVQSQDKSEVEYLVRSRFVHPLTDTLAELSPGMHPAPSRPDGLALDYIRANLLQPGEMVPLPVNAPGPDNDLNEKIGQYVERAMADEAAFIYAFGQEWGPEPHKRDQYFGFLPGRGIHDIHMNQGNPPPPVGKQSHFQDNGVWQDGGLVFELPAQQQWVAVFLKFRGQAWHTDDETGRPIDGGAEETDGIVRIVAALVNDVRSPERETVTLLNPTSREVDLAGWRLADKQKSKMGLTGRIGAGETLKVDVRAPMQLSNKGGIITLLDARGIKVHGVSYSKGEASHPGRTIVFRMKTLSQRERAG